MTDLTEMETPIKRLKDLPSTRLLGTGTPMCAGCGGLLAVHEIYDLLGKKTVFINAAGCMTLLSVYPFTPFRGSWLYTTMASAPAAAQGIRDGLDMLLKKNRIQQEDDLLPVVLTGDGAAYGMGLSCTSAAIDRNLDFVYIIYDNEGYGNTGQQYSAATPHAAQTSTSKSSRGYPGFKKDLFAILAANKPAYAATVIGSDPVDLARKVEKIRTIKGPRFLIALSPCPTGWDYDPKDTVDIGKLAVKTGVWPLKEYINGKVEHTRIPRKRLPVTDYLATQGRFRHLFSPEKKDDVLADIQERIDSYWAGISLEQAQDTAK